MKPTTQTNHNQKARPSFPLTDYNYQPTSDASYAAIEQKHGAHGLRRFWKFGAEFHGTEAAYSDAVDFFVFTLMGIACTWPVFSVGRAIFRIFNGY